MNRKIVLLMLIVFLGNACGFHAWGQAIRQTDPVKLPFAPEKLQRTLFPNPDLSVTEEEKSQIADLMVEFVRYRLREDKGISKLNGMALAKALGLALALDPKHKQSLILSFQLNRGTIPDLSKAPDSIQNQAAKVLIAVENLGNSKKPDDRKLSGFLLDTLAEIDPKNEDAVFKFVMLKQEGKAARWPSLIVAHEPPVFGGGAKGTGKDVKPPKESHKPPLKVARTQSSIKGLVVLTGGTRPPVGRTQDVILSVTTSDQKIASEARISGDDEKAGDAMKTVLGEAWRLAELKHPDIGAGAQFMFSFGDKYTPKDGGSVGTAFTLLLLSVLEDFGIDKGFAVTGDITIDGKIRKIGGVREKLTGAIASQSGIVAFPASNEEDLEDVLILDGARNLIDIQIFLIATLEDALSLAKEEKPEGLRKAIETFDQLRSEVGRTRPLEELQSAKNFQMLKTVLELAPNHASAKYLMRELQGLNRKKLSLNSSVVELFNAVAPLRKEAVKGFPRNKQGYLRVPLYSDEMFKASIDSLNGLSFKLDSRADLLAEALYQFASRWQSYSDAVSNAPSRKDQTLKELISARKDVVDQMGKIQFDRKILEEFIPKDDG